MKVIDVEYIFLFNLFSLLDFRKSTICFSRAELFKERPSKKYIQEWLLFTV